MVRVMYHLTFQRKHALNAGNLTTPSLFLLVGRWSFCCLSQHCSGSEDVMFHLRKPKRIEKKMTKSNDFYIFIDLKIPFNGNDDKTILVSDLQSHVCCI